jgi:hypothetical protein
VVVASRPDKSVPPVKLDNRLISMDRSWLVLEPPVEVEVPVPLLAVLALAARLLAQSITLCEPSGDMQALAAVLLMLSINWAMEEPGGYA